MAVADQFSSVDYFTQQNNETSKKLHALVSSISKKVHYEDWNWEEQEFRDFCEYTIGSTFSWINFAGVVGALHHCNADFITKCTALEMLIETYDDEIDWETLPDVRLTFGRFVQICAQIILKCLRQSADILPGRF